MYRVPDFPTNCLKLESAPYVTCSESSRSSNKIPLIECTKRLAELSRLSMSLAKISMLLDTLFVPKLSSLSLATGAVSSRLTTLTVAV